MSIQYKTIKCTINGKSVERSIDVRSSLTDMLRNDFSLTSVKRGCEAGECGACNVIIDGECYNSCIYLAVWAEGKNITTLEGITGPHGELSEVQKAFVEEGAIQCGFCTPGFVMTGEAMRRSGKQYSDDEVRKELSGHLCRCTGYENIFRAVKKALGQH
jgi:carbon-monoxide dehydrogenase small subunit